MGSIPPNAIPVRKEPNLTVRAARDIAFGSAAGMVSKVIEHPFDLCKVRLQSQVLDGPSGARFNGPLDCLKQTWRGEGVRGLYRGLPVPVFGAMVETACLFFSYSELQNAIRWGFGQSPGSALSLGQLALAAAGSGCVTSLILTPIELVKCKMQVQMLLPPSATGGKPPGPFAIIGSVVRREGLRGLWVGHTGTLIREAGGSAAWFTTKEAVVTALTMRRVPPSERNNVLSAASPSSSTVVPPPPLPWESAFAGACAGVAYNLALFPADTIKSAVQTAEELRPNAPRPTYFGMARALWAAQGLKGLYAGCGITLLRSVPSSAIVFALYDGLKNKFSE